MRTALIAILGIFLAAGANAQQTQTQTGRGQTQTTTQTPRPIPPAVVQPPGRQAQPAPNTPQPPAMPVNIKIDVVVIDQAGGQTKREQVSLTTGDRDAANSRTSGGNPGFFNVDVQPFVSGMPTGKVRVRVAIDYQPSPAEPPAPKATRKQMQFTLVLDDGKMMVASDTTDPASDRRVRVEVTATILK
jgi:hypothetical protein